MLYVVLFTVGVGTAVAAIVQGLLAESVGEAVAGLGIAGLSAASFFAFFLARPLEALERNAIYTQWLAATVTAYWTRMVFLDDPDTVDAEIRAATTDLVGDLRQAGPAARRGHGTGRPCRRRRLPDPDARRVRRCSPGRPQKPALARTSSSTRSSNGDNSNADSSAPPNRSKVSSPDRMSETVWPG